MYTKEILSHIHLPLRYDPKGQTIWGSDGNMVADVRGWGRLKHLDKAEEIQDGIGQLLAHTFNERFTEDGRFNLADKLYEALYYYLLPQIKIRLESEGFVHPETVNQMAMGEVKELAANLALSVTKTY